MSCAVSAQNDEDYREVIVQAVTLEQFLAGKRFRIPSYQRDYAWTSTNVDELFEDINEALETGDAHYMGTFILSKSTTDDRYNVVDGQQRLTTLTMIIHALIAQLSDQDLQIGYSFATLGSPSTGRKLSLQGPNGRFFDDLLEGVGPEPDSPSQKRLLDSYKWINSRILQLNNEDNRAAVVTWLRCIMNLEVLEFIELSEGKAIRMFQTVNDRGVPLSNMERAKSLLIYYSNRYLSGDLDDFVNNNFGECFRDFGESRSLASEPGYRVQTLNRANFSEDDILRYHYLAFDSSTFDPVPSFNYGASTEFVLNSFLKATLKRLRHHQEQLKKFVESYTADLAAFFLALRHLLEASRCSEKLFALFVISDLSTYLYPLVLRLQVRRMLPQAGVSASTEELIDLVDAVDFRVYKVRGTDPARDISVLARASTALPACDISSRLVEIISRFMDDTRLISVMSNNDLFGNPGLYRLFTELELQERDKEERSTSRLSSMREMVLERQSIEHILPQTPESGFPSYGFATHEEYIGSNNRLGNLTILTPPENSRCSNKSVEEKIDSALLYRQSSYHLTQSLAAKWVGRSYKFSKSEIESRGKELASFCLARWPVLPRRQ